MFSWMSRLITDWINTDHAGERLSIIGLTHRIELEQRSAASIWVHRDDLESCGILDAINSCWRSRRRDSGTLGPITRSDDRAHHWKWGNALRIHWLDDQATGGHKAYGRFPNSPHTRKWFLIYSRVCSPSIGMTHASRLIQLQKTLCTSSKVRSFYADSSPFQLHHSS
jgi:hypothetical protein